VGHFYIAGDIVQYSSNNFTTSDLELLNKLASQYDNNFEIRFYGYYGEEFDASVLLKLPEVKSLSVDSLHHARNLEYLKSLENLTDLRIGVFESKNTDLLSLINLPQLMVLNVGETRTNSIDLSFLRQCTSLIDLAVIGQHKNIEIISTLTGLRSLTLSRIKKSTPIEFVNSLCNLENLSIMLGGRDSIESIELRNLKELTLIRIRGLSGIGNVGRFTHLERLHIEDQIKLESFNVEGSSNLREVKVINCKSLNEIKNIENLVSLYHLRVYKTAINYEHFIKLRFNKALKVFGFYTSKSKIDEQIQESLRLDGFFEMEQDYIDVKGEAR
jgi:protein phosphatase 1 regulatory subunit 7